MILDTVMLRGKGISKKSSSKDIKKLKKNMKYNEKIFIK